MKSFDIIIPHCNAPKTEALAIACLQSIKVHSHGYRILWVQNGGEVPPAIEAELATAEECEIFENETNIGFVKGVNQGLHTSTARHVVIMNNDAEAVPFWLERLRAPLVGPVVLAGPRTNTTESWQGHARPGRGAQVLGRHQMLAFFCVMLDRRVLDLVGYLDEDFGVGFGDDDNYCARVHAAGLRIALVTDLVIPHHHRSTFRALYDSHEIKRMQDEALALHFAKLGKSVVALDSGKMRPTIPAGEGEAGSSGGR